MRAVTLATLLLLLACWMPAASAVPQTLSYQGVLRDDAGQIVADSMYEITFWIYSMETGGMALWAETQQVQVTDGIFNVVLGSVAAIDLPFDEQYWLALTVEGEAQLSPRTPLTSAPYAYRAAYADVGDDGDWSVVGDDVYRIGGGVGIGTAAPSYDVDIRRDEDAVVGIRIANLNTGGSSREAVVFQNEDGELAGLGVYDDNSPYGPAMILYNNRPSGFVRINTAGAERLRVSGNGRVGIGVTLPSELLDVAGTVKALGFQMPTGAANGYVLMSDASGNGFWSSPSAISDGDWLTDVSNMWSNMPGNVGIGTSNPLDKLEVNGFLRLDQGVGNGGAFRFAEGGELKWTLLYRPWVNESLTILEDAVDIASMTFEGGTGDVGIKTTNPETDLHVLGDTKLEGNLEVTGDVTLAPVTRYFTVPAAGFVASYPEDTGYVISGGVYTTDAPFVQFVAPVYLPHGATVTSVTHKYIDSSSTDDSSCVLLRRRMSGVSGDIMADVASAGSAGSGSTTDVTIDYPVVDNTTYAYMVSLTARDGIITYGVVIEYTTEGIR